MALINPCPEKTPKSPQKAPGDLKWVKLSLSAEENYFKLTALNCDFGGFMANTQCSKNKIK